MTKVSTTWLRPVCCLRKSGHWPAVNRKRIRPQHFQTAAVRKCAKRLFWPTLPPPRHLHPVSSALYMLPDLLLAHSDLMPMRFVDVDVRQSGRRDKKQTRFKAISVVVRGGRGWPGIKQETHPFHFLLHPCVQHCINSRWFSLAALGRIKREQMCFCKEEGAGGVWPARPGSPASFTKRLLIAPKRTNVRSCEIQTATAQRRFWQTQRPTKNKWPLHFIRADLFAVVTFFFFLRLTSGFHFLPK